MTTQEVLTQYVAQELLAEPNGFDLSADDNLLLSGLIDSLGIVRLVAFIEAQFNVEVLPEDVTLDNFSTINIIAGYLQSRQS
jgi:acyl carrier protein